MRFLLGALLRCGKLGARSWGGAETQAKRLEPGWAACGRQRLRWLLGFTRVRVRVRVPAAAEGSALARGGSVTGRECLRVPEANSRKEWRSGSALRVCVIADLRGGCFGVLTRGLLLLLKAAAVAVGLAFVWDKRDL